MSLLADKVFVWFVTTAIWYVEIVLVTGTCLKDIRCLRRAAKLCGSMYIVFLEISRMLLMTKTFFAES